MPKGVGYPKMVDTARAHNGIDKVTYPNAKVNDPGKNMASRAAPKDTTDGKDISRDATNSGPKYTNRELSPSATANSRNQGR